MCIYKAMYIYTHTHSHTYTHYTPHLCMLYRLAQPYYEYIMTYRVKGLKLFLAF